VAGSVSVVLVRPLVAALGSSRLDAFWQVTDLTPEMVADDDTRITPAQFCVAWAEAVRVTEDPTLALTIATALPPGSFGVVEYVCRASSTLGDALRHWVRYLNLLDDAVVVALEIDDDHAYLQVKKESEAPAPAAHELCFALVALRMRQLATAPFRVSFVELTHPAPVDPSVYRAWFDAPVTFGAAMTQLVLPRNALGISIASADPKLLAILKRAADELKSHPPEDPTMTAQVARALREALREDESRVEQIAKRLGMTPRSLQRRLKDENTSFNAVRENVRQELSQKYLAEKLSIAEISFLLGFSEPSAFFRAFKRWTGKTPIEARRAAAVS
jgi:AraC-like DNA-binding protein